MNLHSPVLFAEAFVIHMQKHNNGALTVMGSVEYDRARQSNYVCGAANGLVTRYIERLQYRLANAYFKVTLVKLAKMKLAVKQTVLGIRKKKQAINAEHLARNYE